MARTGSTMRAETTATTTGATEPGPTPAVGRTPLVVIYHMLKYERGYVELGADYLDQLDPQRVTRYLVKRLERIGYDVTLTPERAAA
ncbi:MAG: hypothetical protein ACYTGD_06770 [Planctomycetota bacterium]